MAGSDRRHRNAKRDSGKADQISTAVRLALLAWEIVSTLVREHILQEVGPWRLL